jgi:hypothetical protein
MMFFSLAWTFWDPKYLSLRRAQLRGQQIRLKGRNRYIVGAARDMIRESSLFFRQRLQATAWILRLINACLLASSQQPFWSGLPQLDTESRYTQAYFAVALTAELVVSITKVISCHCRLTCARRFCRFHYSVCESKHPHKSDCSTPHRLRAVSPSLPLVIAHLHLCRCPMPISWPRSLYRASQCSLQIRQHTTRSSAHPL